MRQRASFCLNPIVILVKAMPFPGILAGSELEKKVDRCVLRVMETGRDKSAAIAICRSAIPGASNKADDEDKYKSETTKSKQDAIEQANYRSAGPASTQICGTCKFGANPPRRQCSLFNFTYEDEFICNRWLPNIEASRERIQQLQMENKARLAKRKEFINEAKVRLGWIYLGDNND